MPLIKGFSASSFEKNVRTLRKEGRETRQCIAIAYKEAREALSRAKKRETKKLREAWKVAIAKGLKGTSAKSKKASKRSSRRRAITAKDIYDVAKRDKARRARKPKKTSRRAPNQPGHLMLRTYGPPRSWSGAVAAMLTASQRAGMQKAWREMTTAQRKETKAAFRAKMLGGLQHSPKRKPTGLGYIFEWNEGGYNSVLASSRADALKRARAMGRPHKGRGNGTPRYEALTPNVKKFFLESSPEGQKLRRYWEGAHI